jgi:eukaryotic-like serine/threonine-protein kinase
VPAYRLIAVISIASVYLWSFLAANVVANKLREKDLALARVRQQAERIAQEVRHGRLTGTILADEYALGELLGRGGMGEIYSARTISDHEIVAVKVLHSHLVASQTTLERFAREATTAQRIPDRYTARVFGVGSDRGRDLHYIVMEYLRGEDLAAYLRRRGPLPIEQCVLLGQPIAEALDAAHAVGVVHRDLKPQNVFLVAGGLDQAGTGRRFCCRLLDFGMSKIVDDAAQGLTQTNAVIGTVGYLSPEQALGRIGEIGPASDRFGFAAMMYRACTGQLPFPAEDLLRAIHDVISAEPPPPSSLVDGIGPDVDAVFRIGLAKHPGQRYASARAFIADLERAATGCLSDEVRARAVAVVGDMGTAETLTVNE